MEDIYRALPTIVVPVSLAMAMVYVLILLASKDQSDLVVALIGLLVVIGSVLTIGGRTPGIAESAIKQILLCTYYAISLWHILRSTTRRINQLPAWIASSAVAVIAISFLIGIHYLQTATLIISQVGILIVAIRTASVHFLARSYSLWIVGAFAIYHGVFLMLLLQAVVIDNRPALLDAPVQAALFFLSIAFTSLLTLNNKFRLERMLDQSQNRWSSFAQSTPFLIVELNQQGNILSVNEFGAKLLGYDRPEQLRSLNWFDTFALPSGAATLRKIYAEVLERSSISSFKSTIRNKDGKELVMNWVNFIVDKTAEPNRTLIAIGVDATAEERAAELIGQLRREFEKEKSVHSGKGVIAGEEKAIGKSQAFAYAIQRSRQVAITHAPVLLEGEPGVGKDLFANLIHRNSSRSNMPFIKVNCAALLKDFIEDELFGHEKGAFDSAIQAQKGRFELADGGTIFLDEVAALPLDTQAKILRLLQHGELERLGGQRTVKVDVRILAATNRDLFSEASIGNFQSDLFHRLSVFPITIPALRNRKEDIPDLVHYFIDQESKKYNKSLQDISKADLRRLVEYPWPGNIRELKNVIERAVILSTHTLRLEWWSKAEQPLDVKSDQSLEKIEKDHILAVMAKCQWKINGEHGAAEILNMHPNTLRSKMKRLDITRPALQKVPVPGYQDQ